jgi:hypothetical protein
MNTQERVKHLEQLYLRLMGDNGGDHRYLICAKWLLREIARYRAA